MKSIKKLTAISLSALTVYSSGINVSASPANVYGQQKSIVSEALAGIPFYRKLIYGLSAAAVLGTGIGFAVKYLNKNQTPPPPVAPAPRPAQPAAAPAPRPAAAAQQPAAAPQPPQPAASQQQPAAAAAAPAAAPQQPAAATPVKAPAPQPGSDESGLAATPEKTKFTEQLVLPGTVDGILKKFEFENQRDANPIYNFFRTLKDYRYNDFRMPTSQENGSPNCCQETIDAFKNGYTAINPSTHQQVSVPGFYVPETEWIGDKSDELTPANIQSHCSEYGLGSRNNALGKDFGVTLTHYANLSDQTMGLIGSGKALFLNFANYTQYGGGFLGGGTAQEESMCLLSNLFASYIKKEVHDEYVRRIDKYVEKGCSLPTSILISKGIGRTVVDGAGNLCWKDTGVLFDVASVAAPNFGTYKNAQDTMCRDFECSLCNKGPRSSYINPLGTALISWQSQSYIDKVKHDNFDTDTANAYRQTRLYKFMKWQYEQIIAYAHRNGIETIVSGAFGCGVYRCDPVISALALKDALAENKSNNPASSVKRLVLSITGNGGKAALYDNKEITAIFKMVYEKDV